MHKQLLFALGLMLLGPIIYAQEDSDRAGIYEFNETILEAFDHILALKMNSADKLLDQAKADNPYNLMPYLIEDYADYYKVFASGSTNQLEILGKARKKRLEKLATGDEGSPYFLFAQADVHLHEAILRLRFGFNEQAVDHIREAYKLIDENIKIFPKFEMNKKILGSIEILVDAVPGKQKWRGLKGNLLDGLEKLVALIDYGKKYPKFEFNKDMQMTYAMMLLYIGSNSEERWRKLNDNILDHETSLLDNYIIAKMNLSLGNSSKAFITVKKRPDNPKVYYPFPHLTYIEGICMAYRLDMEAVEVLERYLEEYGGVHFLKNTCQKLAWLYLIDGKETEYKAYIRKALVRGTTVMTVDKYARQEALTGHQPNPALVKARLLAKGGYYSRAMGELDKLNPKSLKEEREQIEVVYRKARIFHEMRRYDDALIQYDEAIKMGNRKPYYFAPSAALYAAKIWESRGNTDKASAYYEKCLKQEPAYNKELYEKRAQAQLDRIKEAKKKK